MDTSNAHHCPARARLVDMFSQLAAFMVASHPACPSSDPCHVPAECGSPESRQPTYSPYIPPDVSCFTEPRCVPAGCGSPVNRQPTYSPYVPPNESAFARLPDCVGLNSVRQEVTTSPYIPPEHPCFEVATSSSLVCEPSTDLSGRSPVTPSNAIRTRAIVIALQHSRGVDHRIVPKEICLLGIDGDQITPMGHEFFAPPHPDESNLPRKIRGANAFIVSRLHGVPWTYGDVPHDSFLDFLHSTLPDEAAGVSLFTKGTELASFFSELLDRVVYDLDDVHGVDTLSALPDHPAFTSALCVFHNGFYKRPQNYCAVACAGRMAKFLAEKSDWDE